MKNTDISVIGRCNSTGESNRKGNYVRIVYHDGGNNRYLIISEECAENLAGQIAEALVQREDVVQMDQYPTAEAYEAVCKALQHWRAEAMRLGKLADEHPREMYPGS